MGSAWEERRLKSHRVVLRRKSLTFVAWSFALLLMLIGSIALASLADGVDADALGVAAVCLVSASFILRVGRARIVLADVNVLVVNPVFTYAIPCRAVREVREEHTLIIVTNGEGDISSAAFGSSLIDHFVRSTERASDEVARHVRAFRGRAAGGVVRRMTRAWVADACGLAALVCAVAAVWAGSS